jgi:hypothetical protein
MWSIQTKVQNFSTRCKSIDFIANNGKSRGQTGLLSNSFPHNKILAVDKPPLTAAAHLVPRCPGQKKVASGNLA